MALRGKEVRPLIDEALHERLSIMAECEGLDIAALGARLLEKSIVGEWLLYERQLAMARAVSPITLPAPTDLIGGFVYVIRIGERYKIGKAADWQKRLSNAMFPEPPVVVCIIATHDRHRLERELHDKYDAVRVHGEWFELSPAQVAELLEHPGVTTATQ